MRRERKPHLPLVVNLGHSVVTTIVKTATETANAVGICYSDHAADTILVINQLRTVALALYVANGPKKKCKIYRGSTIFPAVLVLFWSEMTP